jgi:hypothetical protein
MLVNIPYMEHMGKIYSIIKIRRATCCVFSRAFEPKDFVVLTVSLAQRAQMLYSGSCAQELAFWCWVAAHLWPGSAGLDGLQQKLLGSHGHGGFSTSDSGTSRTTMSMMSAMAQIMLK